MRTRGPALLAIAVTAMLAGCTTTSGTPVRNAAVAASAKPSPSRIPAKDELLAALRKTHKSTYTFTVRSDGPDKERIEAKGSVDPRKKFAVSIKKRGGKFPASLRRIVLGNDIYDHDPIAGGWAHLDMKRLKKNDYLRVDMANPTGLATFTSAVISVNRDGPHTYRGMLDATPTGADEFLPVGAPSLVIFGGSATFTATTNAEGWVTSIEVELKAKETLKMTTTFGAHGKPVKITKPSNVGEAYDFYYD
ncbi:hypothetical protein AB0J80_05110 [Actinoplanes sp. NPDC049548]|uniref:hypothetical protein n=1 Tax=Actinoplanes sp. NPDC049548 TaxID=3155152 RepID=UPI00343D3169